jgi:hypothetical protein
LLGALGGCVEGVSQGVSCGCLPGVVRGAKGIKDPTQRRNPLMRRACGMGQRPPDGVMSSFGAEPRNVLVHLIGRVCFSEFWLGQDIFVWVRLG